MQRGLSSTFGDPLGDRAKKDRPRDGRIAGHLGEPTALKEGHELAPTAPFGVAAATEAAPVD